MAGISHSTNCRFEEMVFDERLCNRFLETPDLFFFIFLLMVELGMSTVTENQTYKLTTLSREEILRNHIPYDKLKLILRDIIDQCFFHKNGIRFQHVVLGYADTVDSRYLELAYLE